MFRGLRAYRRRESKTVEYANKDNIDLEIICLQNLINRHLKVNQVFRANSKEKVKSVAEKETEPRNLLLRY